VKHWTRRRALLAGAAAGGGLLVAWAVRALDDGDARLALEGDGTGGVAFDPWIRIAPDGLTTFGIHRAEMGQSVITTLAMLLAEELDADWARVRYAFTGVDRDYYHFGMVGRGQPFGPTEGRALATAGTTLLRGAMKAVGLSMTISSASTIDAWDTLRPVAATARAAPVDEAARRWQADPARLSTRDGVVRDADGGRSLGYGELALGAAARGARAAPLKSPGAWRFIGRDVPRIEAPSKVDGRAGYGIDVRVPGMRRATVVHSPVFGGVVGRIDPAPALAVPGVERVIELAPEAVGIVARDTWAAFRGADALVVDWRDPPSLVASEALAAQYRRRLDDADAVVVDEPSEVAAVGTTFARIYEVPFLAHACLEPMNATAHLADGQLTVWVPTQAPTLALWEAARVTGLPRERVTIVPTLLGGGFGRRTETDLVVEAARLAQALPGTPVQVTWRRSEDLQHDAYRPAATGRLRATLTSAGVAAIDCRVAAQSVVASFETRTPTPRGDDPRKDRSVVGGLRDSPYALPGLSTSFVPVTLPVPVGFWRSVTLSYSVFFLESFIDELAIEMRTDPVTLRRAWLAQSPRALAVLEKAAARGRLAEALPAGRGRGIALSASHGSFAAVVVDVEVADGAARIVGVTVVADCGQVIRPSSLRAQLEGAVVDGLWAATRPGVRLEGGRVTQSNFHDYPLLRIDEVPPIEVQLVESSERPGGAGEPALPPVAPALGNALYRATGQRSRALPFAAVASSDADISATRATERTQ
jgi:isoquinoline 1-oxidoreductase beta subunit